jgi:putative DeoR family transcriptional regulator (stage III sporulation protein D)
LRSHIEERAIVVAKYILEKKTTVRQTAKTFGVSKSTIHKDVTERLEEINPSLAKEVKMVLEKNKSERHIRGGMATKQKYETHKKPIKHLTISEQSYFRMHPWCKKCFFLMSLKSKPFGAFIFLIDGLEHNIESTTLLCTLPQPFKLIFLSCVHFSIT